MGKFSEIKKRILEDSSILMVLDYSRFVSVFSNKTEELASIVNGAKLHDALFGKRQEELLEREGGRLKQGSSFSPEDVLASLVEEDLEEV